MSDSITYTGTNAQKVIDWASKYGFKLNADFPAEGENIHLYHKDIVCQYAVSNGHTLTDAEFRDLAGWDKQEGDAAEDPGASDYRDDNLRALALDQAVRLATSANVSAQYPIKATVEAAQEFYTFLTAGKGDSNE